MPGVMDIKHLLCHPCDPYPSKILKPTSTKSSSKSTIDYNDDGMFPKRRRVNSETTFKEYSRHFRTIVPRRHKSASTVPTTTSHLRVAWTPSEDDLLQQGYEQGLSWGMIASTYLPHRSRGCCWGRFKMLQNKQLISPPPEKIRFLGRPWKLTN